MYDLCCIGHLTRDKIVTPAHTVHMTGGTSFYFSHAIKSLPIRYHLVTALAEEDADAAAELKTAGVNITVLPSRHTVYFENIYPDTTDHRIQRVLHEADPFRIQDFTEVQSAYFHLGPLLATDISVALIQELAAKGKVSLDVQGYLRKVENASVIPADWKEKQKALAYISILKASEDEAKTITGETDMISAAKKIADWGVQEVVITKGGKGSLIYDGEKIYNIPAYRPVLIADATGCGDTYMAGYLYQRIKGAAIAYSGAFGAAMAAIKIAASGPFNDTEAAVEEIIYENRIL